MGVIDGSHLTGAPKKCVIETQRGAFTLCELNRSWQCLDLIFQLFLLFNLWMAPKPDPKPKFQEGKIRYRKALSPLTESSVVRRLLSFSRAKEAGAATAQWRVYTARCVQKSSFSRAVLIAFYELCRFVYQQSSACTICSSLYTCTQLRVSETKH